MEGPMAADGFQFSFTPQIEDATAPTWEKVRGHVTPMEWRAYAPLIAEINRLKAEKDAVILARNVARQTDIKIIAWQGRCEVHERFTADDIRELREAYPDAEVLAHPECPAEVLELADFAGSTSAMNDYVVKRQPKRVVLITECSMADN